MFQLSIHDVDGKYILVMKGAPEKIMSLCSTAWINGADVTITPKHKKDFEDIYNKFGNQGQRVLGKHSIY